MTDPYAYYASQATLIGAAGVVLRDPSGAILLVKPTYKAVWHLPGGIMEPGETPSMAARREVREEIGLDVVVGRLLSVDFKSANDQRPPGIQFVFDGGRLSNEQARKLKTDPIEIETFRFVACSVAVGMVEPGGPAARMVNTLAALSDGRTIYLENGHASEPMPLPREVPQSGPGPLPPPEFGR